MICLLPSGKANCEGKQGSEVVLDTESRRAACVVAFSQCKPECRPGLGPSHLHSCEQSLLAPVIPLTLLGARISPACRAWHPASCLALAALVELPELSLACLPKMISSSRAFTGLMPKPGSVEFLFLTEHPLCMAFPWDGRIRASCRAGHVLFQAILLQCREG